MRKRIAVLVMFLAWGGTNAFADDTVTLAGKVTDAAGKPLAHATVIVYHAGVKQGYSAFCPSCYADCGKRAVTDASGAFTIEGLNCDLWFELLAVHDGYTPTFVEKVDPLKGEATAVLSARTPVGDPSRVARGRVVDTQGAPMRDAVVTPLGLLRARDSNSIYGTVPGLDPIAVSNEKGEFEIAYAEPMSKVALMVEARAMAPKFVILPSGSERQTVTVAEGAVVRGRLVDKGQPVAGAEIGLIARQSWVGGANLETFGSFYGELRIGTQEDGSFAITNVPAPEQWYIYGRMESLASRGATDPLACATTHDHQEVNVGDLQVKHAYRLQGKVLLSDGKQVPEGMRVTITSDLTRDYQTALISADGRFAFAGLAPGDYSLYASVTGYELKNGNGVIAASVHGDVDKLEIPLDPSGAAQATH
jgi:hypothetical protein